MAPVCGCLLTGKSTLYIGYLVMRLNKLKPNFDAIPPWATRDKWQAANAAIAEAIRSRPHRFAVLRDLAQQIRCRVDLLDPMLDALCADTCPGCTDNCCVRATLWYDLKDLLAFHLGTAPVPAFQLAAASGRPCRFLDTSGCALPRIGRPFICTWFVCAAQRRILDGWLPSSRQFLDNSLLALKDGRNRLEKTFIREVVGL